MSSIAWLDTSPEDERRMREIVRLFSDTGTLDDLGIGQVRDGLADLMFPGTSTIHARPRYFLIVPWTFQRAASRHTGTAITSKANDEERKLIEVMRTPPAVDGMIGKLAGKAVRVLPSRIYWSALQRYGILADAKSVTWNVPIDPPSGFPRELPGGLDLTAEEAEWLRERIMLTCRGSYLAHLLTHGLDTSPNDADSPWTHPSLAAADTGLQNIVEHARMFSLAINGATLIYNLMVAEKYDSVSADADDLASGYRDAIDEWATELEANRDRLTGWDRGNFWATVHEGRNAPVALSSQLFADNWFAELRAADARTLADSARIRDMIADRERKNKGEQCRLNNERQIRNWGGSSGAGRLTFRWFIVQRLLTDIRDGLASADA
ncbi:DUF6361 family protein [Gordonia sp. NPDC003504]